jgi:site-specific DNA-methyltransferase (adenine-specific)|tara:strand:- start:18 stop:692 length:675 start_codon:yes stop_codon:yes gene_type:complete
MINLFNGDSLEVMKELPDDSIDITITSPPYNLGSKHHTGSHYHQAYSDNLSESEYQNQQIKVLNEIYRITKDAGSVFYNHKNRIRKGIQITPYEWLLKTKLIVKQELVWFNRSQNFDKIRFYPMTERIYWLVKNPKTKLFNAINHHDVFDTKDWKPVGTKGKHTRAFPEKLVKDILLCFDASKVVLDCYMGTGTTGAVAKELNKDFIGIEVNPEYYHLAEERIK